MNENERLNYRMFLLKEFNKNLRKQMNLLAVKLISVENKETIVKNN